MKVSSLLLFISGFFLQTSFAQHIDTIQPQHLEGITIKAYRFPQLQVQYLEEIQQTYITSGKKNEVVVVHDLPSNITEKNGRQIFAKIPGAFVYDMDGSGNQVNLATRGLDPHRSWEYNVRLNGVLTNSDMYGYPASHYSAPLESIQRIEIIRGTASLRYGAQFGGMINYITKRPDTSEIFAYENISSVGSFGLLSTYHAAGGKIGRLEYYAYFQRRESDGYRDNARSKAQAQFASLRFAVSPTLSLRAELARSQYRYQLPGPLSDAMFEEDPRQSTRQRNYYSPDIYVPSASMEWRPATHTRVDFTTSAIIGTRSSVQLIGLADVIDTIDAATLAYKPRQVDIDHFNSYTSEISISQDYTLGAQRNTFVAGIRYIQNDLHRQQQGKGTTGTTFDLTITEPHFGRDVHYKTKNVAVYAEHLFRITPSLQLSPGIRIEEGLTRMRGIIAYLPDEEVPKDIQHRYALLGISGKYQFSKRVQAYGGWSQAYRPVIFSDVIPATPLDRTDPEMEDSFGHNAELGIKGSIAQRLNFDLNFFQVLYNNRIGTIVQENQNGEEIFLRTNIGDSRTNGIELYAEYQITSARTHALSIFTSTAFMDGRYISGVIRDGEMNVNIEGNKLETVPEWTTRNGFQFAYKQLAGIFQYSYVSKSYSDALNTETPSPNGSKGVVPGYGLLDLNLSYKIGSLLTLRGGINNLLDKQYFTKRPTGYPGAGVWPSDGRSLFFSAGIRL